MAVKNTIEWSNKAARQFKKIAPDQRKDILNASRTLENMTDTKNVKALKRHQYGYRLRVGNFRILFNWEASIKIVNIEEVKKRDEHTY